ncbi:MAG: hypothetical protein KDA74_15430 [Planctomycetaceae bacterium]|nr:hypothetical protein [Planctomycetaceae bacterium]
MVVFIPWRNDAFPATPVFKVTQRHILRHSGLGYMVELELQILKAVV